MGLAAHLEGVMNGMLLLILGAVWQELRLGARAQAVAFWTLLYGTYANWGFTTLAAIWGTVGLSPVTAEKLIAAGRSAAAWQENFVLAGFISVGLAMLTSTSMVLWGLRARNAGRIAAPAPGWLRDPAPQFTLVISPCSLSRCAFPHSSAPALSR